LAKMPLEAMVRNLGKMSHIGLVLDNAEAIVTVVERLHQQAYIKHSRLHPLAILEALKVYGQGHGEKGKLTWAVNSAIIHALDDAFYLAFDNVAPTNKSIMLGLDVSSSMSACSVPNSPLSCAEAAVVMALVTARREPQHVLKAFSSRLVDPKINPDDRLEDALRKTRAIIYGGTDCSLLTQYALAQQEHFDGFVTYTDSETWMGSMPITTLNAYRRAINPTAKQIVVGMTATEVTIADPADLLAMDIAGFDTATPQVIGDFIAA